MQIAEKLGVDYEEILEWSLDKFQNWVAYFRVVEQKRKAANGGK